jgi:hypothetical protein
MGVPGRGIVASCWRSLSVFLDGSRTVLVNRVDSVHTGVQEGK